MDSQVKDIILKILTDIGYTDDKEKFAQDFLTAAYRKTLVELLNTLPKEKQKSIAQDLNNTQDGEKAKQILMENFSQEQIKEALEKAVKDLTVEFLQSVSPSLSEDQKAQLLAYSNSLQH